MKLRKTYVMRREDRDVHVTLVHDGSGGVWVETAGGQRISDALVLDQGRTVSIRRDGRMYLIDLSPLGMESPSALINGRAGAVEILDELEASAREQAAHHGGASELKAEMPGMVVEIKVAVGDEVEAGQSIVVLEAMKMQNELPALGGGVVSEILVKPGQSVDSGALLVRFDQLQQEGQA